MKVDATKGLDSRLDIKTVNEITGKKRPTKYHLKCGDVYSLRMMQG